MSRSRTQRLAGKVRGLGQVQNSRPEIRGDRTFLVAGGQFFLSQSAPPFLGVIRGRFGQMAESWSDISRHA